MKSSKTIFLAGLFCLTFFFQSCSEDRIYEKPTQLISNEMASEMHKTYNSKALRSKSTDSIKEDANAVWYSVEELERYINYIKEEGINKGYAVDGIRLYLGRYPDDPKYAEKAGMTTIFLSPTGTKTDMQKSGMLNVSTNLQEEPHYDITDLSVMNYGSMGNPPKMTYPFKK